MEVRKFWGQSNKKHLKFVNYSTIYRFYIDFGKQGLYGLNLVQYIISKTINCRFKEMDNKILRTEIKSS